MGLDFKDKEVLITGGTRGIGEQIAKDFTDLGANVLSTGTGFLNFLDDESTDKFLEFIKDKTFDICINNAGINTIDNFCSTKDEDWEDIMQVNLTGAYKVSKAVAKNMQKNQGGRIINVASIWSHVSRTGRAAYSASKFGLRGLTVAMAAELAKDNILVNSVSPGFTRTELTEKILGVTGIEEAETMIPMQRLALPSEISKVVLFLASDLNTYISGQDLVVDGGFINV